MQKKTYMGLEVPAQLKKEWTWMLDECCFYRDYRENSSCKDTECRNCIYSFNHPISRKEFYNETFNKENEEMGKMPELKNFDVVEVEGIYGEKYALVNKDAKSIIYINPISGNLCGFDWFDEGKPQDKLKHIVRIWRIGERFNGGLLKDLIDACEEGTTEGRFTCFWEKEEEPKEVTMEELNKMLKDKGLPSVKIKE